MPFASRVTAMMRLCNQLNASRVDMRGCPEMTSSRSTSDIGVVGQEVTTEELIY